MPPVMNQQSFGLPVVRSKADRQDPNVFQAYMDAGAIPSEWTPRDFAIVPQETFNQIVDAQKSRTARPTTEAPAAKDNTSFIGKVFNSIPWAGDEVPPIGVMPDAMPSLPQSPLPESNPRADAIRADFEAIRNGQVQNVPPMAAVTSNQQLLAQDNRMNQLAQLRDTLASMNPQARKPEPVVPSESARTGMRGSDGYQRDRNTRLAILNEQERNRKPTTAGPDATINLDTLPEQLKQVYAQRAENEKKRQALVNPLDGNTILPVAKTVDEKKARAAQYEADGLAVPAVFQGMASPEKVRADKMRRAQEESYRQGNWSMLEQARGLSQKLGINPLLATAMVSGRMAQGPALSNGEPRMPDSWEPRLRNDPNSQGMQSSIMDAAMFGPQGAAILNAERIRSQGMNERAQLAADTQRANVEATGKQAMDQLMARGQAMLEQMKLSGANAQQLAAAEAGVRRELQNAELAFKDKQLAAGHQNSLAQMQEQARLNEQSARFNKELNPTLPLDVQLEGQQIAAERERLSAMGANAPPDQLRRLQMREQALQQRIGGRPTNQQSQWPSSLAIAPDINAQLEKLLMSPESPEMVEWGPDNWDIWHPWRVGPNLERAAKLLAEQNPGMPPETARNYAGEWLQNRRDSSILPFNIYPSREAVGF